MGRNFFRGLRKTVAPLAVLGLMAGGGIAALSASTASATQVEVPCSNMNTDQASTDGYSHVLAVCKSGPETAAAGTDVSYDITVYASGSYNHDFEVTDDIPQGTTFVSADGGDTWTCGFDDPTVTCTADDVSGSDIDGSVITVTVHVPSSFTDEGIENCASIQKVYDEEKSVESDGYNWVWTSCADTDITREFDVSIEKTGPASLVVPADATYTITASNAGPSDSDLVSFTDPVPAGTTLVGVDGGTAWDCSATTPTEVDCTTLEGIPAGESVSATVTLSVPIEHAGTALENCATLASDEPSAEAVGQSCTTIEGANVTVKAAEVVRPVTGVAPKFTG